ncbi:MAG TPA: bifunctional riboflavin kinase/FAD synthetase [Casimicrobiaceae bacterium]|nr:bifunctional riboflavin kinase/FAD synthetase [Casimicrobiaceae bacterium]
MQVFRGLPDLADRHRPIALTIGNFDGVHRGHQAMLARLSQAAEDLALPSAVLTFDPHPREFFAPGTAPPRLSTLRSKLEQFSAHGIAEVHVARFNAALAALPAARFIEDVLVRRLGTRWVLVGDDFRFGQGRSGDLALLRRAATSFSVEAMPTVIVDGERASSTAIRAALAAGELVHAARLLGRPYAISGKVVHGDKLGRSLGFPTANIVLRHPPPLTGVFAVRVHGLGGVARSGAASLGVRPTVKAGATPLLEVFVFDFDEAVYGRRVVVEFLRKLRDEERYADLETLTRQIRADVEQAREYFATASSTAR